jgi:hypothetical protein
MVVLRTIIASLILCAVVSPVTGKGRELGMFVTGRDCAQQSDTEQMNQVTGMLGGWE